MSKYQSVNNLKISEELLSFVNDELLKEIDISPKEFWSGFDKAVHDLSPLNKELIKKRESLQKQIDDWHLKNKGNQINIEDYKKFLKEIKYLKDEGEDFKIETTKIDNEIANIAGPQLVVPIMNARYTLNAAIFFQLVPSIGIYLSKNSLTYFITSCPLRGSYLSLPPSSDSIILVP